MRLTVVGAGMAGLVAAARARDLGADVAVLEKGDRAGGSMLLSSCVVWRHREFADFRRECPDGDEGLQRLVWERFDEAIAWLERSLAVEPVWQDTVNPLTTGRRYHPLSLRGAFLALIGPDRLTFSAGGDVDVHHHRAPVVLATGGFPVRVARDRGLLVRSNPWSEGDGLDYARVRGATTAGDLDELYARAMPAPPARVEECDYVRLAQLYGGRARVFDERGRELPHPPAWHESDLAQAIAAAPGGTAWVEPDDPDHPNLHAAREAGGEVVVHEGRIRVHVAAGVTHTLGGLAVDRRTRVLREDGGTIDGLYAAGVDVGGIASGGYASGLAQALVLGLVAAEEALAH